MLGSKPFEKRKSLEIYLEQCCETPFYPMPQLESVFHTPTNLHNLNNLLNIKSIAAKLHSE